MIPAGPDPNTARTERFFACRETENFTPILNAVAATSCDVLFFCSQWVMTQTATFTPSA